DEKHIFERNHSNKTMPLELAFEEVQKFYNRTNQDEGYIVFYGGEPLLAFEMIKKIVSHANIISNHRLKFSLTTNGLALSDNKFDFIIENNFLITVSLDGDKETHDKQRATVTGKGTFDAITNNLNKLKNYNSQFLKNNVLINCVISDANDLSKINQFFKDNDFAEESLRFSPVLQNNVAIDGYITNSISLESVKQSLKAGLLPVENHFLDSILKKIEFRKLDAEASLGKKLCVPFANRTYVRTDGTIQFCERIENYGKSKNESVNLAVKSEVIYNEFKTFKQEACSKCFAYNFCEMCPASFIKNSQFDNELANSKCSQYRKTVEQALQIYINKMEYDEVGEC
ncbi:MAG: radical SAM protein, partial [Methylococcales bacterium]|nr:radical SAM protein [Methylococcales bacterium]